MTHPSDQHADPLSTGPRRHRRYRVLGALPALLLLAAGAYLGLALGDWILFDGAALYLLISVAMIATDTPPRRPPDALPDAPPRTPADVEDAPARVPVTASTPVADRSPIRP